MPNQHRIGDVQSGVKDARCSICIRLFIKQRDMERLYQDEEDEERGLRLAVDLHEVEEEFYNHLQKCRGDEWENGRDLVKRLKLPVETVTQLIPICVFTEAGDFKLPSEALAEWPDYCSLKRGEYAVFNTMFPSSSLSIVLEKPINWWFSRRDVLFYEKLHPELHGVHEDNPFWLPQVTARNLGIHLTQLEQLVLEHNLPVFRLDPKSGITLAEAGYLEKFALEKTLFDSAQVKEFEALHPDLCGIREPGQSDEVEERIITFAEVLRGQHPDWTIAKVDRELRKMNLSPCYGKNYYRNIIEHLWHKDPNWQKKKDKRRSKKKIASLNRLK